MVGKEKEHYWSFKLEFKICLMVEKVSLPDSYNVIYGKCVGKKRQQVKTEN